MNYCALPLVFTILLKYVITFSSFTCLQIQKFALRFLSVYETEQFITSLKEILDDSSDAGEPSSNFGSAQSPPSECIISSESLYRPTKDWSPVPSDNTHYQRMSPILNHEALQTSNPPGPIYYNPAKLEHGEIDISRALSRKLLFWVLWRKVTCKYQESRLANMVDFHSSQQRWTTCFWCVMTSSFLMYYSNLLGLLVCNDK